MEIESIKMLRGELSVPGDKSISHRAVMFGAIAKGLTEVRNFLRGADCRSSIHCFRQLSIDIEDKGEVLLIRGNGLHGLTQACAPLDAGNSGTTVRLLSGILSAQPFTSVITGDASIQKRPMKRIIDPLTLMGADIRGENSPDLCPLKITGKRLKGITYTSPIASAQVKSAILLAGLYADAPTTVTEPSLSRNHTEIMLSYFGAGLSCQDRTVSIRPEPRLEGRLVAVPGDISSAAYFIAAALILPGSEILIKNVGINKTRDGIFRVIRQMGGQLELLNQREETGEPTADLLVKHSRLKATVIAGDLIPTLIDELPIIAVLACFAEGETIIRDAEELKVKESNRIDTVVQNLTAMGARVTATEDGMIIEGGPSLQGAEIDCHMDHRIAMSFAIAGLAAKGTTRLSHSSCVNISYPGFFDDLKRLSQS